MQIRVIMMQIQGGIYMRLIGNLIWFLFTGLLSCIVWCMTGLLFCLTVIGIPFGVQCFKIARLLLWPMGHTVTTHFSAHPIANLIWIVLFGWEMCAGYVVSGAIYCITVVGIPFGLQCFKLAELSLCPFGASVQ